MPVLVVWKFEKDPIKTEGVIVSTIFFQCSKAGNSEVNGQMCPEFKLGCAFMVVLAACKFDDDMIKK